MPAPALPSLTFDDWLLLLRVAQVGSFSAVARERNVPVSAISRAVARMEKACGAQLLHRSTHGLSPTAQGAVALAHAARLGDWMEGLRADLCQPAGQVSGLVRVAASSVVAHFHLLPSLDGLHAQHPQLRVDVQVSDTLADMVHERIDIAIRSGKTLPDTVVARRLGALSRALYASPAYLAAMGTPRQPSDLAQHRLITNSAMRHLNDWPFVVNGAPLTWAAEGHWRTSDTHMATAMVLQGLGIGRIADVTATPLVAQGRLAPVLPTFIDAAASSVPIHAITARGRQRLPALRACLDYWAACFATQHSTAC